MTRTRSGDRTKNGEAHNVPLSPPAKALVESIPRIANSDYVFTTTGRTGQAGVDQPVGRTSQAATGAGTTSRYADGTVTGQAVSTRYGDTQVQVTISGGAITDVTALQLPDGDGHSARISSAVEPMLRSMALQAQSANIDLVSGATYTSGAYRESLQSALDAAAR